METGIVKKVEGKLPELQLKKNAERNVVNPPRVKHLRYSKRLPLKCDDCPYRPKSEGGNGVCPVYKEGALCIIRKDIRKEIEKYSTRNPDQILPLMQEELEANYEKLKFFEALENLSNTLNPEVTKRINALNNLGKTIQEIKTKKSSVEIEERRTLSEDKKEEIARIIRMEQESSDEAGNT